MLCWKAFMPAVEKNAEGCSYHCLIRRAKNHSEAFETIFYFLGIAISHSDQLTLAEFCACRTRKLVTNLQLVAIAKAVQLRDKSETAGAENADDDADDAGKKTARMTEEFMEGDHDIEAGADMNEADVSIGSTR